MSNRLSWRYRRLLSIVQRVRTSVALRGWRGTMGRVSQQFAPRPSMDYTLDLLPLGLPNDSLALPTSGQPLVSIIIPVYGKVEYTLACLRSIAIHAPSVPFEVIVVDDASPDGSADLLSKVEGIRLLRNEGNLGFVGSCNAGAAAALGEFAIFLNNDTQVMRDWTEELLRCFELRPNCGIAGSQLVYPDGRLQEAGAWVYADASAWNIGRFEPRQDPSMRFAREVDYVSGASLAVRRRFFEELGGFDTRFAPGYYEDTDLAFAARDAGYSVWYVPTSVVVHMEGISSAGVYGGGMKRYQDINRTKFMEKWQNVLARQPKPGTPLRKVSIDHYRGTVLVVDVATPDASRDSGSLRLIAMMRLLVEDNWHVVFAPDDGHASDRDIALLGAFGIEIVCRPWQRGVPTWISANGEELRAAILSRHTVAAQYESIVRKHAPHAKIIFDTVDLHFLREERAAQQAGSTSLSRRAQATRKQELGLIAAADITFVVSVYERELLSRLMPDAHVELVSNIHEVYGRTRGFAERRDLLFIGGHGHPPNADAMRWMADEILPALRNFDPSVRIFVAGDVPESTARDLTRSGLDVLGRVDDLAPLMNRCLASIAPLRFGAGVKGKINMSMSHGLPVIGTSVAVEGMHLTDGVDVLVADDAAAMAVAYRRLACNETLWMSLSDLSIAHVDAYFSGNAAKVALRASLG